CAANLQPLCSRHHHLKHEAGWSVEREIDGSTTWISPSNRSYVKPPEELPRDTTIHPDDDPPPF
ncbi:MAG TPA: hypothetical protein VKB75_14765, partial [Jatrophihabitans sp.]|nr:hypothetical protein [Jatrophihabitans sp.]